MTKKFLSLILSLSFFFTMVVPAFAASQGDYPYPKGATDCFSESVVVDNEKITFYYYTIDESAYIKYQRDGQTVITERNNSTGIIKKNGEYIGKALICGSQNPALVNNSSRFFAARAASSWVKYGDPKYGDITSDVLDTVSWAVAISASLSLTVKPLISSPVLAKIVESNLPTIYYEQIMYYKNPVTTPRPVTRPVFTFYKDAGRTRSLGTYDLRV